MVKTPGKNIDDTVYKICNESDVIGGNNLVHAIHLLLNLALSLPIHGQYQCVILTVCILSVRK